MATTDPRADYANWTRLLIEDFRAHGGHVSQGPFKDRQVLLLHTVGAKSGEERIAPLAYSRDGDRIVIVASKGGAPTNPSWYANLVANPVVTVERDGRTYQARAVPTTGDERGRLWAGHVKEHPGFAEYESKTSRVIPVITLDEVK